MNLTVLENRNMILLKICSPGKGLSIHVTIVRFNKILAILCFLEKLKILLRIGHARNMAHSQPDVQTLGLGWVHWR
jgi:hypothetical protein